LMVKKWAAVAETWKELWDLRSTFDKSTVVL
jgi:hypothetical protein